MSTYLFDTKLRITNYYFVSKVSMSGSRIASVTIRLTSGIQFGFSCNYGSKVTAIIC